MERELLGISNVHFNAAVQLLIICCALVKINLHCSIIILFSFSPDVSHRLNRIHTKSSHNTQTALGLWKDVGRLKKRNWWQFVGDGGSSQFNVTNCCCNGPLCFAELVHGLFYKLRSEQYVTSRYVYIYICVCVCVCACVCVYVCVCVCSSFSDNIVRSVYRHLNVAIKSN